MARIVIVEDDASCGMFLDRLLTANGHEVMAFQSGREALERGAGFDPHLLITDWLLKDHMDGTSIIRGMRDMLPKLPVIVVSGLPRDEIEDTLDEMGNARMLEKPIDFDVLLDHIAEFGFLEKVGS